MSASSIDGKQVSSRPGEGPATSRGKSQSTGHEVVRAQHGGIMTMAKSPQGLLGIEAVVQPDGAVRIYGSDSTGAPIAPEEIGGTVTCERGPVRTTIAFTPNHVTGAVEGRCAALASQLTTVTYEIKLRGIVHAWTLRVPAAGTAGMAGDSH